MGSAPELCVLEITLGVSPLVTREISTRHLTDHKISYVTPDDLPRKSSSLLTRVNSINLSQSQIDAINYSLDNEKCTLGDILKRKGSFSNNTKSSYLRVPFQGETKNSVGQDVVLEIWPKGHFSPVHNHGDSLAIIKILQGTISSEWYNPIVNNSHEKPQRIKTSDVNKGDITWMLPHIYQTHKLINNRNDTAAITVQAYAYPEDATELLDHFYYVLPGDPILHEFYPNADIMFEDLLPIVMAEFAANTCGMINEGDPSDQGMCCFLRQNSVTVTVKS